MKRAPTNSSRADLRAPSNTAAEARRSARAGFTLIEVMTAAALFAIGIVGVTYMQGASIRSNQDAYEGMIATNFARTWIDRIKRDSLLWTASGLPNTATMFEGAFPRTTTKRTSYFVPGAAPDGSGLWLLHAGESPGANYHGIEVGTIDPLTNARVTNADIYYCAVAWFTANPIGVPIVDMRVDLQVWWARKASLELTDYTSIASARASGCDAVNYAYTDPATALPENMRRVSLAAVLHYVRP